MAIFSKFGIVVASVGGRKTAVFGDLKAGHGDIGRKGGGEFFAEFSAIVVEMKAKRAAEDDAIWLDGCGERYEAE